MILNLFLCKLIFINFSKFNDILIILNLIISNILNIIILSNFKYFQIKFYDLFNITNY